MKIKILHAPKPVLLEDAVNDFCDDPNIEVKHIYVDIFQIPYAIIIYEGKKTKRRRRAKAQAKVDSFSIVLLLATLFIFLMMWGLNGWLI